MSLLPIPTQMKTLLTPGVPSCVSLPVKAAVLQNSSPVSLPYKVFPPILTHSLPLLASKVVFRGKHGL